MVRANTVVLLSIASSLIVGCASRGPLDIKDLPPTAAGGTSDHIIDRDNIGFYTTGDWRVSSSIEGFEGQDYLISKPGTGENVATWNLNIIRTFDVFAKWTSTQRRGSNVKFIVHHLDSNNNLVTETVTVNQRESGGQWFKLGTYRMSTLTGRVTVSDDADGWVVADAILFRETGITAPEEEDTEPVTDDTDGDGMPDDWENQYGLDPNDPSDAELDADGDGLTNKDEHLLLTDPTTADTDGDYIPDGFEVSYGLDPTIDDGALDSDSDGLTNYQEYLADTDPNDSNSTLPSNSVLLTWEAPTQRTDGSALAESEIAQYELAYGQTSTSEERIIDNESTAFSSYGGGRTSTGYGGYIGNDYFIMEPGSGEVTAQWQVYELSPQTTYQLSGHWVSSGLRASNATYRYTYIDSNGQQITGTATVDQRSNGGTWQPLGTFETSDTTLVVEINNNADGYVVADAIKLSGAGGEEQTVFVERTPYNSYVIHNLGTGEWQFKIRAIDTDGVEGEYSEIGVRTIQ